jgi:cell division protein FtsN
MTRDYKPPSRHRKSPASGSGSSMLVGILIGLLLGLGIALAVAIYLNRIPGPFLTRGKPAEPPGAAGKAPADKSAAVPKAPEAAMRPEEKRRFDFYEILPGNEGAAKSKGADQHRPAGGQTRETFYLQAGAFQALAEADNMKARLALLGIEADIQSNAVTDRGTLHRVRIGPFSRVEDVNRTRETLKQNGIDSTLIKGRDAAS